MRCAWLPAGVLVLLAGYFGPWVDHRVAGLVVTGLDLGEYVKFLPGFQNGEIQLWRPGFYAPLIAASAISLLIAYRRECAYRVGVQAGLLALAAVAMLNLIPPAWTPARLLEPEFRVQTTSLVLLGLALLGSPWLAFIPRRASAGLALLLLVAAAIFPTQGFLSILPAVADLYAHPIVPGWGFWLLWVGTVLSGWAVLHSLRPFRRTH